MLGVSGTGPYSVVRDLRNQLRMDRDHLENAPLGPIQKKRLAAQIKYFEGELEKANAALRAHKNKRLKSRSLQR